MEQLYVCNLYADYVYVLYTDVYLHIHAGGSSKERILP